MGSPERVKKLLRRLGKVTSEDALIIAETVDPYRTDNPLHLEYHRLNRNRGRLSGQARIRVRFEKTVTRWMGWLIVSKEEMEQLLAGTEWKVSRFIDCGGPGYIAIIKSAR